MERTISIEDRIRRAEEIYNRKRQDSDVRVKIRPTTINKKEKVKIVLFKKLILKIAICIVIYLILYLIKNSNYIFSESVIQKTKDFLSYDINFNSVYNTITSYYNDNIKPIIEKNNSNNNDNTIKNEDINVIEENVENQKVNNEEENVQNEDKVTSQSKLDGIGGGEDQKNEEENIDKKEKVEETIETSGTILEKTVTELSQMEIDANDIKKNYNIILPLVGTITSRYGPRTPTAIVSANHAGIDIAVNEGTVFVAAMDGKVITASGYGSYGNHIFIENGDVITVYAHCKTLYVKEGEMVLQGQKLGEVGQTGNATGPHLHFEIRKGGRTVNPEYVLSFG